MDDTETAMRKFIIENSIANQRMEGGDVSAEVYQDLQAFAEGTLTTSDAIEREKNRIKENLKK